MSFQLQPILAGELLRLRPLTKHDFDDLCAAAADPLIWAQHPKNRSDRAVFTEFFTDSVASGGALVALDASTGEVIGTSRYNGYDKEKSEIEIGWSFLARAYWGGRYNSEMKRLMLAHAFQFVENVIFVVDSENLRSQKAVEKIGGKHRETRHRDGERTNFIFCITREAYNQTLSSTITP